MKGVFIENMLLPKGDDVVELTINSDGTIGFYDGHSDGRLGDAIEIEIVEADSSEVST